MKKYKHLLEAYLDIETTGLSPDYGQITVIGIYLTIGNKSWVTQLVGNEVTDLSLSKSLEGVDTIYTYNGSRFDLPFIHSSLKLDLESIANHHDLMYDCWRNNLYGGLKSVEQQLGIDRILKHINGYDAIRLWWKYVNDYDEDALATLLEYNREDVVNLSTLKRKLLYHNQ